MPTLACPGRSCTTLGCTPARRSWVAWLWRGGRPTSSYVRESAGQRSSPAASQDGEHDGSRVPPARGTPTNPAVESVHPTRWRRGDVFSLQGAARRLTASPSKSQRRGPWQTAAAIAVLIGVGTAMLCETAAATFTLAWRHCDAQPARAGGNPLPEWRPALAPAVRVPARAALALSRRRSHRRSPWRLRRRAAPRNDGAAQGARRSQGERTARLRSPPRSG